MKPILLQENLRSLAAMPAVVAGNESDDPHYRARVKDAAEKFEAFFIANMLKQMRSVTREMADEDSADKKAVNQDMLEIADGKLAESIAGRHAFGIADAILRQLLPAATGAGALPVAQKVLRKS